MASNYATVHLLLLSITKYIIIIICIFYIVDFDVIINILFLHSFDLFGFLVVWFFGGAQYTPVVSLQPEKVAHEKMRKQKNKRVQKVSILKINWRVQWALIEL